MNIFQRLFNLFSPKASGASRHFPIYILSHRCNEPLVGQVDTMNELSLTEDGEYTYFVRKVLHTSGRGRCFGQVEVQLWFNRDRQLAAHEEFGGRWLSEDEYQNELVRFNTPAPPMDVTTESTENASGDNSQ